MKINCKVARILSASGAKCVEYVAYEKFSVKDTQAASECRRVAAATAELDRWRARARQVRPLIARLRALWPSWRRHALDDGIRFTSFRGETHLRPAKFLCAVKNAPSVKRAANRRADTGKKCRPTRGPCRTPVGLVLSPRLIRALLLSLGRRRAP